jgi:RNA polymerase sigma factor (sigma-70 family)
MSVPLRESVVRPLRRLAWQLVTGDLTDGQLFERFRTGGEEEAFAALVQRHGPMVLGVCRRVLHDRHDAEDAFQATFLILLRKTASIAQPERLGNWLYGVAYNTARNARLQRARRAAAEGRARELTAARSPAPVAEDQSQPWLDEELSRLPEKYRLPIVLCALHGRSRDEVARQLGCPEGTLSSRLARARELLRRRLARRGLLASSALATLCATGLAPTAMPAPLVAATIQAALASCTGPTAVTGPVLALAEGVLRTMWLTKLKMTLAVLLTVGVATGVGLLAQRALAQKPAKAAPAADSDKKGTVEAGPTIHATVKALDRARNTITVDVPRNDGTKTIDEKTFAVAADVKVTLDESLSKEKAPPTGQLTDLSAGTSVTLQLAADRKTALAIHARGPTLHAAVAATEAGKNALTIRTKGENGLEEHTFTLAKGAQITLSDGLSKEDKPKQAQLSDLAEGTGVEVQLSVDRKTALAVRVLGDSLYGPLEGVDLGNNTITLKVKEDGQLVDKTLTMLKGARVEGAMLNELRAGQRVVVTLSVFDKTKAAAVVVLPEE